MKVNSNYQKLPGSYLFSEIARRVAAYSAAHPDAKLIKLGIGDVTRPLPAAQSLLSASVPAGMHAGSAVSAYAAAASRAATPARGGSGCGLRLQLRGGDAGRAGASVRPTACPARRLQSVRVFYPQFCPWHVFKLPGRSYDRV